MTTLLICAALFLSFLVLAIVVAFVYMITADADNQGRERYAHKRMSHPLF